MIAFVADQLSVPAAAFADYAQRDQDSPRTCGRVAKIPLPAEFRVGRLAGLSPGRYGRGMGHGPRRTHRPGDACPSAGERRPASGCGGAGANWPGRPCTRARLAFYDAGPRDDPAGTEHGHVSGQRMIDLGRRQVPSAGSYGQVRARSAFGPALRRGRRCQSRRRHGRRPCRPWRRPPRPTAQPPRPCVLEHGRNLGRTAIRISL